MQQFVTERNLSQSNLINCRQCAFDLRAGLPPGMRDQGVKSKSAWLQLRMVKLSEHQAESF